MEPAGAITLRRRHGSKPASSQCQQDELYRAEERVPRGAQVSLDRARQLAARVVDLPWVAEKFPMVRHIEVDCYKRRRSAGSVGSWHPEQACGRCEMAPQHMTVQFLLHEFSHCLCEARYGPNGHGPWFARIYLTLAYLAGEEGLYEALYAEFLRAGIQHDCEV